MAIAKMMKQAAETVKIKAEAKPRPKKSIATVAKAAAAQQQKSDMIKSFSSATPIAAAKGRMQTPAAADVGSIAAFRRKKMKK